MTSLHTPEMSALQAVTRRQFLRKCGQGLGALWLAANVGQASSFSAPGRDPKRPFQPRPPHFTPKASRIIYLHMAGAPSQLEMFDYKPELQKLDGRECPNEFLEGKRFAFITGVPKLLGSAWPFHREKQTGLWISSLMPKFEKHLDKVSLIHTMQTDQFNHAPAQLLVHTGSQNLGAASFGSWMTYGLGTANENLPGYIVLLSGGTNPDGGKSLWGSGFLPSVYQGVQCRSEGDPVLYLKNPPGVSRELRGKMVDTIASINRRAYEEVGDPETLTRIAQYEMAFRMQASATDAFDLTQEPPAMHALYGTQPGRESFANNCLLARRLVERGVRFVQLFDWGWDTHGTADDNSVIKGLKHKCDQIDQPVAALLSDLQQRGLLEDTLVIWGGEFGRTPMLENRAGVEMAFKGRDHHPAAFTIWMAGGGVKGGYAHGETDPIGYNPVGEPVQVRDLHATLLHLLGIDHKRLVYPFQGLDQKLTSVRSARIVEEILA
jgi:hypothetical protein